MPIMSLLELVEELSILVIMPFTTIGSFLKISSKINGIGL
tara:strand:- start:887 stop:1006 length:120 start_codon:yes stop_codon:yes gene_type:complete